MATVDTSIYRMNPLRSMADYEGELLQNDLRKQGVQQNAQALQMGQQKADEYTRSIQDANALRNVVKGFGADPNQNVMSLYGAGRLTEAQAYQKAIDESRKSGADVAKSQMEAQKTQLANGIQQFEIMGQLSQGVVDQATHDQMRQQAAARFGPEFAAKIPAVYNPQEVETNKARAVSIVEQMKQRIAQMDFEQKRANDMLVPDPSNPGKFMPNQPLINAKTQVAQAGASAINNYGSPVAGVDAEGKPVFFQPTKTGGAPAIVPGVRPPKDPNAEKPLTEVQGNATTFAARMVGASSVIDEMEKKGVSGSDPRTMAAGNIATNWAATPEGQQYRQAQENWVTANLRKESGAAIPVAEMDKDIAKWFPKVGDSRAVRDQKAQARRVAQEGMLIQAGPGAKQVPGIMERSAPKTAPGGAPVSIASDEDYNALKPGTRFVTPDGKTGTKR